MALKIQADKPVLEKMPVAKSQTFPYKNQPEGRRMRSLFKSHYILIKIHIKDKSGRVLSSLQPKQLKK